MAINNGNSTLRKSLRRAANVVKFSPTAFQVLRSGAFDSTLYKLANPDTHTMAVPAYWHFARYHISHERPAGQGVIHDSLLTHIIKNRLTGRQVRPVLKRLSAAPQTAHENILREFYQKHDLPYSVLSGYIAQEAADPDAMHRALSAASRSGHIEDVLLLHYDLTKSAGFSPQIFDVAYTALEDLERGANARPLRYYRAILQICEAIGITSTRKEARVLKAVLTHMVRTQYAPVQSMQKDLWSIGAYFGDLSCDQDQKIRSEIPGYIAEKLSQARSSPASEYNAWEPFLIAATSNMLGLPAVFVTAQADGAWQISPDHNQKSVMTVRVMTRQYWAGKTANPEFHDHLRAFLRLCREQAEAGFAFYPISAGQIYDLSMAKPEYLPVLSYHSFAVPPLSGGDIHFKETELKQYYSRDCCGFSGWACPDLSQTIDDKKAESFFNALFEIFVNSNISKYEQKDSAPLHFAPGYLFVALQVPGDVVSRLRRVDAIEAVDYLLSTQKAVLAGVGITQIVVKVHPMDKSRQTTEKLSELQRRFPEKIIISTQSVHDLIKFSRIVMTVNSGVGAEALLHLKPVLTLGSAYYDGATQGVETLPNIGPALETAIASADHDDFTGQIQSHLYRLYAQNCFKIGAR